MVGCEVGWLLWGVDWMFKVLSEFMYCEKCLCVG